MLNLVERSLVSYIATITNSKKVVITKALVLTLLVYYSRYDKYSLDMSSGRTYYLYRRYVLSISITRRLYSTLTIYRNYLLGTAYTNTKASLVEVLEVIYYNTILLDSGI